jgi:hypothetical protein
VLTAILQASAFGYPNTPVETQGKATDRRPAASVDRPDRVDDVARRQPIAGRHPRLPDRAAAERAALGQQFRSGGSMNRSVHTASAEQAGVRRVDDGVDLEAGDVARHDDHSCGHVRAFLVAPGPA